MKHSAIALLIIVALAFALSSCDQVVPQGPHEATLQIAPPPIEGERFVVTVEQIFFDGLAYDRKRAVYVIKDMETGRSYLGLSGIGISELGSHSSGEDTKRDER